MSAASLSSADLERQLEEFAENDDLDHLQQTLEQWRNANSETPAPLQGPLATAAVCGSLRIVRYLISQGAKPDSNVGMAACDSEKEGTEIFDALLAAGWDFKAAWGHGGDPLLQSVSMKSKDRVRWLLDHGVDPNKNVDESGNDALDIAVCRATTPIAKLLIEHGSEINNAKLLIKASRFNRVDMLEFLLELPGAAIDEIWEDRYFKTNGNALHEAARDGKMEAVVFLLSQGADRVVVDHDGKMALQLANENEHQEIAILLRA